MFGKKLVNFNSQDIPQVKRVLNQDIAFLEATNVMDYSLLLTVIELPPANDEKYLEVIGKMSDPTLSMRMFKSDDGLFMYCVGVIDYLQDYNCRKFFEGKLKNMAHSGDNHEVSVTNPTVYSSRFLNFCREFVFINI